LSPLFVFPRFQRGEAPCGRPPPSCHPESASHVSLAPFSKPTLPCVPTVCPHSFSAECAFTPRLPERRYSSRSSFWVLTCLLRFPAFPCVLGTLDLTSAHRLFSRFPVLLWDIYLPALRQGRLCTAGLIFTNFVLLRLISPVSQASCM